MASMFSVLCVISLCLGALPYGTSYETRMSGGETVNVDEFPYQASIQHFGRHICGGVILNRYFVLTAARCFENVYDADEVQVRVGSSGTQYGGIVVDIKFFALHPEFNQSFETFEHDVALIKLSYPLFFDKNIQPASLNKEPDEFEAGTEAVVIGWERKVGGKDASGDLRKLNVKITDFMDCYLVYIDNQEITEKHLCASSHVKGKGACKGDVGSPLTIDGLIVGVLAWFRDCEDPNYPAIYINLAEYVSWINELMASES